MYIFAAIPTIQTQMLTTFWDAKTLPIAVWATDIRDEGSIIAISHLPTLESVTLACPGPCDDWLRHLESLPNLKGARVGLPQAERPRSRIYGN